MSLRQIEACRKERVQVVPLMLAFLQDPKTDGQVRANAALALAELGEEAAIPILLRVAAEDANAGLRFIAMTGLSDFGPACPADALRRLYGAARSRDERGVLLEAIGNAEHAGLLDLAEGRDHPHEPDLKEAAERAARQIRIAHSPFIESDLVVASRSEDWRLKAWAVRKLIGMRFASSAHYLREILEEQLKLPLKARNGGFEFFLVSGIREIGAPLSETEVRFLASYSEKNPDPLPRE